MPDTLYDPSEADAPASEGAPPTDGGMLAAGTIVDHFRVTRLIGRGGMGEVYVARDLRLGRRVALKIVAPGHFESSAMRERFLIEAQTTARFSHPNIVTIYAVGEYAGCPYLALEYLEGETLLERMRQRLPSEGEAARIALAIAEALAEAHRHGVLHRDLKPGNVHLGRDGRVRVLDFGLAKVVGREAGDMAPPSRAVEETFATGMRAALDELAAKTFGVGTPAYMAPEQWMEDPGTGATDVWSAGVVLFAMLTGRLPFQTTSLSELAVQVCGTTRAPRVSDLVAVTSDLDAIVATCLEKDPSARLTSAELVERLQALVSGVRRIRDEDANPFRGLLPFTRDDEHVFFGREAEIAAFVERMRADCVLPVVGASGSGKSSFVQAGVVPRLLEQDRWTVLALRVGRDPFASLAARLLEGEDTSSPSHKERQQFDAPTRVVHPTPKSVDAKPRGRLQTVSEDEGTMTERLARRALVAGNVTEKLVTSERERPLTLVMSSSGTFRRDVAEVATRLEAQPSQLGFELRALAEARGTRVLLFVDQLEELFTQGADDTTIRAFVEALATATDEPLDPVRVVFTIRDDFFGRLAVSATVGAALGRVTLMQRPDASALEEILTGPLRAHDYAFEDEELAREMVMAVRNEPSCLPLLQFTANLLWTKRDRERRRLTRGAYRELGGVEGALARHADGVLAGLSENDVGTARRMLLRLVTPERTRKVVARDAVLDGLGESGPPVLARFIEARLLTTTKWLDQRSTTVIELAHESLIRTWGTLRRWVDESNEDVVVLGQLEQAARLWLDRGAQDEQLWRGDALAEARRFAARTSAELPTSIRDFVYASERAESGRRGRRRLMVGSAFLVAAAVAVSSVLAGFTIAEQRDRAERGRAEALREGARAALAQGLLLEARAKVREALELEDSVGARLLWRRTTKDPLEWTASLGARVYGVAFSHDGTRVLSGSSDGVVTVFDAMTRSHRALRGHTDQILSVAASSDGRYFASSSLDRTVRLWDAERLTSVRVLEGHKDAVHTARFSPDGTRIAAGSYSGELRVWRVADGKELVALAAHSAPVRGVAWSADGSLLASGDATGGVKLWHGDTLAAAGELESAEHTVVAVAFRPDGAEIATSSLDGVVRLYDVGTRRETAKLSGHTSGLYRVAYSTDGKLLVSTSDDRRAIVWDVRARKALRTYTMPSSVTDAAFAPDGAHLAVGSVSEEVGYWRVLSGEDERARGHDAAVNQAALSPDGTWLASGGNDGRLVLWDASSGAMTRAVSLGETPVTAVAITPDGKTLVTGSGDGAVRTWTASGEPVRTLITHPSAIYSLAVAPDGRSVVVGAHDGAVVAIDLHTTSARRLVQGRDRVRGIVFDRGSSRVVSVGHDGHVRVFSVPDGQLHGDFDLARGRLYGAAMHPTEAAVAVATADGALLRVDLETGATATLATPGVRCYGLDYEKSGAWLAAPCADGTLRVISRTGEMRTVRAHEGEANTAMATSDGRVVATASDDFTVQLFDTASWTPRWFTRGLVPVAGRGSEARALLFSQRGWTLPGGEPAERPAEPWALRLEGARGTAVSRDGKRLCLLESDGTLEELDFPTGRSLGRAAVPDPRDLIASATGCYALGSKGVTGLASGALTTHEAPDRVALGEADEGVLVASPDSILHLDASLRTMRTLPPTGVVSALASRGTTLLVGYRDGHLERRSLDGATATDLEGTSASPVLRIVPGPADTWVAGFGNGDLGLWASDDVRRLERARLHGPVTELRVTRGALHAATQRGDGLTLDLQALEKPRCELLDEVRREVRVLWRDGRAVVASSEVGTCR